MQDRRFRRYTSVTAATPSASARGSVRAASRVSPATALLASMATLLVLAGNLQQILAFFMCPTLVFVALAASALIASWFNYINRVADALGVGRS